MATTASERQDYESYKFGGTAPDSIYVKTLDQHDASNPLPVSQLNSLITDVYDYIALTYVSAGNGIGEIETVTYKSGGSAGTTVGVLTISYNSNNKISSVTKS